jgi:hypothetical protein
MRSPLETALSPRSGRVLVQPIHHTFRDLGQSPQLRRSDLVEEQRAHRLHIAWSRALAPLRTPAT